MESCLQETLKSVINQTYKNLEIICVNDGSTDSSANILNEFASHDNRFIILNQENGGPAKARNKGLDYAHGDYVMMLDSDDIYSSDLIESLLLKIQEYEADVAVCRCTEYDHISQDTTSAEWTIKQHQLPVNADCFSPDQINDFIFTAFIGWPWDKLYRRSFIEQNHLRYPELHNSEDLYFVFLSLTKASKITIVDKELIRHRVNRSGSVSNSRKTNPDDFYKSICLLKEALKQNSEQYPKLYWGFLNWALDYTLWNIWSMNDDATQRQMIRRLKNHEYSELELLDHSPDFFQMIPGNYVKLLKYLGYSEKDVPGYVPDKHPWLSLPNVFLYKIQHDGLINAVRYAINWLRNK